ncbi:hypothetical protein [Pseudomonas sp. NA-150]|uniref:hypothetical protein n=1 Tax=Pseudomonas sp. NA-150 TaxID=3367525 RepID=UPI0037CCB308
MSFVSGLGRPDYTIPVQRTTATAAPAPAADFLSLNDSTVQGSPANLAAVANQSSGTSQQSEQEREEAFARLMVNLQSQNVAQQTPASSTAGTSSSALTAVAGAAPAAAASSSSTTASDPLQDFQDYMKLSPAERMRANILKGMGLTDADVKAMSPADQDKINAKVADIIKKQTELQANASGTAAPSGSADSSGTGSSADNKAPSFLNKALSALTQSANDATANLNVA